MVDPSLPGTTWIFTKRNRFISIIILIVFVNIIGIALLQKSTQPFLRFSNQKPFNATVTDTLQGKWIQKSLNVGTVYYLDTICDENSNDSQSADRARTFDNIYETAYWGSQESRSGGGSSIEGAFDWIRHLRSALKYLAIESVADIPCGDTYWQFSIREMNTIKHLYFGGDISDYVIQRNRRMYAAHRNKLFYKWDIVQCPPPTFTIKNSTHELKGNSFDLVIIRDALQHMHIRHGLQAIRNIVSTGAKYLALTSFPPNNQAASHGRSFEKNESVPIQSSECDKQDFCQIGAINDGDFYPNNINCPPFSFPLQKALLVQPSHKQFYIENDEIHIYQVDEALKELVRGYDKACLKS